MRRRIPSMSQAVLIAVAAAGAVSDASAGGTKKKDPLAWEPPTHIQMTPMMLPAGSTRVPITFFLEAKKPANTEAICKHMPRIRDAVLRVVYRKPIPVAKRRLVLKGLDQRILRPINTAVGKRYVNRIFVTKGAVPLGAGKIKKRPLAVIDGCVNILRSSREREQAARAANK